MNMAKEDDLDTLLDNALEEFKTTDYKQTETTSSNQQKLKKDNLTKNDHPNLEEEFLKQLTAGIEELFGNEGNKNNTLNRQKKSQFTRSILTKNELSQTKSNDDGVQGKKDDIEEEEEDMEQVKQSMAELLKAMAMPDTVSSSEENLPLFNGLDHHKNTKNDVNKTININTNNKKLSVEEAISNTMNKLNESSKEADGKLNDSLKSGSNAAGFGGGGSVFPPSPSSLLNLDDESMGQMMKDLEKLMDSGEFNDVFDNMIGQLMSRDILYEPMKELSQKYPEWISKNKDKLNQEELKRYNEQNQIVCDIVAIYKKSDQEPNEEDGQKIVDLMQKMQESGNPPEEIMKEMGSGLDFLNEGSKLSRGEECNVM